VSTRGLFFTVALAVVAGGACTPATIIKNRKDAGAGGDTGVGGESGIGGTTGTGGATTPGTGGRGTGGNGAAGAGGAGTGGAAGSGAGGLGVAGTGAGGSGTGGAGTGGSAPDGGGDVTDASPALAPKVGDVIISEIMLDTAGAASDDVGEWFELYNTSPDRTFDLGGCAIQDTSNAEFIVGHLEIHPHQYLTLARSAPGFTANYTYQSVKFADEGDLLRLSCGVPTVLVDIVDFGPASGFTRMQGKSLNLDPDHYSSVDNDLSSSWCLAVTPYEITTKGTDYGTPGVANGQCP
jgi:hypothetical protein